MSFKKNKVLYFIFASSLIVSIVSCNNSSILLSSSLQISSQTSQSTNLTSSDTNKSTNSSSSEISQSTDSFSSESDSQEIEYYKASYSHVFSSGDFLSGGGKTSSINGLIWTYSKFAYRGFLGGKGVQIGSAANPQTSLWSLSAVFPDGVKIESYSFELAVASGGSAEYSVSFGPRKISEPFSSTELQTFYKGGLDTETSSFSLGLKANQRAMYLYSVSFDVLVPLNINFDIYPDKDVVGVPVKPGIDGIPVTNYTEVTPDTYYQNINFSLSGDSLVEELRTLVSNMTKVSYGDSRYMLLYTDEMTDKPGYDYGMWDGDSIKALWDDGSSWNREHVWACDQMQLTPSNVRPSDSTRNHASDLHNLRVACPASNGYHSNKFFDSQNTDNTLYPNITSGLGGHHAYSGDFRGDTARILFYMYVRYEGLKLDDAMDQSDPLSMGKLSALIEWNKKDPVDSFEEQRNDRIYEYQGNRNPFIDHPEIADSIW